MEKQQITYGNSQVELWDTAILWLVTGSPGKLSAPRTPLRILADFSTKFYKPEGNGTIYLKWQKTRVFYPSRLLFRCDGEIKSFQDKQKLREFRATKSAVQQMLKELL